MLLCLFLLLLDTEPTPTIPLSRLGTPLRIYSAAGLDEKVLLNFIDQQPGKTSFFLYDFKTDRGIVLKKTNPPMHIGTIATFDGHFIVFAQKFKQAPAIFLVDKQGTTMKQITVGHLAAWADPIIFTDAFVVGDGTFICHWTDAEQREISYTGLFDPKNRTLTGIQSVESVPESEPLRVPFFNREQLQVDMVTGQIERITAAGDWKSLRPAHAPVSRRYSEARQRDLWYRTLFRVHWNGDLLQLELADFFDSNGYQQKEAKFKVLHIHQNGTLLEKNHLVLASYAGKKLLWDYPNGRLRIENQK